MKKLTITIATILCSIALHGQMVGWGPSRVHLLIGKPGHVEQISTDTILRTYNNDRYWAWYKDNQVAREIYILDSYRYRRDGRRLSKYNEILPGWKKVDGEIMCRVLEWSDEKCLECRKIPSPQNIRINPIVEQ